MSSILSPKQENIIGAWLFNEGTGTALYDYNSSNNATIVGADWEKIIDGSYCLDLVSTNSDHITIGNIGNVKSILMWIKLDTTTEAILEGDPNAHIISVSAGTLSYTDFDNAYVDGSETDTIDTEWHLVAITSSTDVNMTDIELGLNNATYGDLKFRMVILFNEQISQDFITKFYQETFIQ